ncbi:hypothetical protein EVA_05469 [gut metagenome]|uniref:Uncharacterized protein n=1 Tax=gut metagenome TaxID=749906 RepID=J9D1H2_9ZZZZ
MPLRNQRPFFVFLLPCRALGRLKKEDSFLWKRSTLSIILIKLGDSPESDQPTLSPAVGSADQALHITDEIARQSV